MIKYLATASLLLAGAYLSTGTALAADPAITDTEIVIGDVEPLEQHDRPSRLHETPRHATTHDAAAHDDTIPAARHNNQSAAASNVSFTASKPRSINAATEVFALIDVVA